MMKILSPCLRSLCRLSVLIDSRILVDLALMGGSPRPISVGGRCTPSVGKLERISIACCLVALFIIPSMLVCYRSLKTLRYVAGYWDLRMCSTTRVLYVGLSFRLVSALANFLISLMM